MRQARAKQVSFMIDEDLRLVFEATEGGRMDDTIAITLEERSSWRQVFSNTAATGVFLGYRVRS
jgi:hypothetical protein